ncbi:MAG: gluconeogenesis factor YvcK family protein [Cyanobacteria bacterium P01_C01_bin.89]
MTALQQDWRDRPESKRVNRWAKWLMPGLLVKRWMLLSTAGTLMIFLGLAIWTNQTPVFYITQFLGSTLSFLSNLFPSYISGPVALAVGIGLVLWGQKQTFETISHVYEPSGDRELIDRLWTQRKLNRGPHIVAIGGGTGLSTVLRGLKHYSSHVTGVVTVADDGGSSGRLRREIGVLPPGDVRNCLAALSAEERLMTELFQYRFTAGDGLAGHSFGNLFLTAMSDITGDMERAIAASSKVLAVQGQVLPATLSDVQLWAEMDDGRIIEGESQIPEAGGTIIRVGCTPASPPALPKVLEAIRTADYIIIGPGSLYTSIIPNLLVPEITEAIARSTAPCVYVCNIMSQRGETDGYSVADHIRAIDQACGWRLFDTVLVQKLSPSPVALDRYASRDSYPVPVDREAIAALGRRIVLANVMDEDPNGIVRHHSRRLGQMLLRWYGRLQTLDDQLAN